MATAPSRAVATIPPVRASERIVDRTIEASPDPLRAHDRRRRLADGIKRRAAAFRPPRSIVEYNPRVVAKVFHFNSFRRFPGAEAFEATVWQAARFRRKGWAVRCWMNVSSKSLSDFRLSCGRPPPSLSETCCALSVSGRRALERARSSRIRCRLSVSRLRPSGPDESLAPGAVGADAPYCECRTHI
jgi:hypothetical protein